MLQGLWERDPDGLSALKSMPLGIIRGGTSNGLFATILVRVSMPHYHMLNMIESSCLT